MPSALPLRCPPNSKILVPPMIASFMCVCVHYSQRVPIIGTVGYTHSVRLRLTL